MADLINLRTARKNKQRQEKSAQAEINRAIHGRSKPAKIAHLLETNRSTRQLDNHRREPICDKDEAHSGKPDPS